MDISPITEANENENISELLDDAEELVGVVEQAITIAGVRSVNGKAGDLNLKTINNTDLLTTGNLDLATSAQMQAETEARQNADIALQNTKQDNLTAGANIQITNNVISATDTTYTAGAGLDLTGTQFSVDTDEIQPKLTAGTNVQINDNVISATDTTYTAGNGLTLTDTQFSINTDVTATQTDISNLQNTKQNNLTSTQLDAVNSGITSAGVSQITTNKNNITDINGKIPAQASDENQLADKNFVNSSIATETANYISNDGEPFTSVAQLEAYTGTVTDNDYAFVTGTDSAGNTYYDRYKATVSGGVVTWAKEYRLNNSSFTSEQWTAINSGATTALIGQITTNQNNIADLQTSDAGKLPNTTTFWGQTAQNGAVQGTLTLTESGQNATIATSGHNTTDAGIKMGNSKNYVEAGVTEITLSSTTGGIKLKPKSGSSVDVMSSKITNLATPTANTDASTKKYVDDGLATKQNTLTAGDGINIASDTISVTDPAPSGYWTNPATVTGQGSTITLNNTLDAEIVDFKGYGDTNQASDPTPDSPQNVNVVTGNQTVSVSGKNLIDVKNLTFKEKGNVSSYTLVDGKLTITPSSDSLAMYVAFYLSQIIPAQQATLSGNSFGATIVLRNSANTNVANFGNTNSTKTLSDTASIIFFNFGSTGSTTPFTVNLNTLQIELGSTPTAYEPYQGGSYTVRLGSMELCKIGTYQDYIYKSGDKWYKHEEVGKASVSLGTTVYTLTGGLKGSAYTPSNKYSTSVALCDRATQTSDSGTIWTGCFYNNPANFVFVGTSTDDSASLKAKYDGATIYYMLATPTDTEITNAELLADLNALAEANTIDGQTNIMVASVSPNLPMIAQVQAYQSSNAGVEAQIASKQDALTAGANIQINGDTISATDTTYTAGTNVQITGTTISATDTTYSAGTGLTLTGTTFSVNDPAPSGFFTGNAVTESEGTAITLPNALGTTIKNVELEGDTSQTTYTGKNLFNSNNLTKATQATTSLTILSNGWEMVTSSTGYGVTIQLNNLTPSTTYTISGNLQVVSGTPSASIRAFKGTAQTAQYFDYAISSGSWSKSFTLDSETTSANIWFYNGRPAEADTKWLDVQFEAGSATAYEPYVGGIPSPNPDYPQNVNVVTGKQTVKIVPEQKNIADPQTFIDWLHRTYGVCVKNGWGSSSNRPNYGEYQGRSHVVVFPSDLLYSVRTTMVDPTYDEARQIYRDIFKENTVYTISMDIYCTTQAGYINLSVLYTDGTTKSFTSTGVQNTWVSSTLTTGENKTIKCIRMTYNSGVNYIDLDTLQIEEGTTKTAYTPFVGQSYDINLGKNLFNESDVTISNGYVRDSQAQFVVASGNKNRTIIMRCLPNTTYTISKTGGDRFNVFTANQIYSSGTNDISNLIRGTLQADTQPASQTIATGSDTYLYIHICSNYETYDINEIMATLQVEYGNEPTTYSAYFAPIELCKIGTYQDYIYKTNGNWYKHAEVGKAVYTGATSENWYYQDSGTNTNRFKIGITELASQKEGYCNSNKFVMSGVSSDVQVVGIVSSVVYYRINKTTLNSTSASDFKTWLATHNMILYTALATATDTQLTNADLIAQLEALASAQLATGINYINSSGVRPNLDAILTIDSFNNNWNGLSQALLGA